MKSAGGRAFVLCGGGNEADAGGCFPLLGSRARVNPVATDTHYMQRVPSNNRQGCQTGYRRSAAG